MESLKNLSFEQVYETFRDMSAEEFLAHLKMDAAMSREMSEQIDRVQSEDPALIKDSLTFLAVTLQLAVERFKY